MEQDAFDPATADGTALPFVRSSESLRIAGILYAACLGLEVEPERSICQLASQRLVRVFRGPETLMFILASARALRATCDWGPKQATPREDREEMEVCVARL